jgi:hypothetical protein
MAKRLGSRHPQFQEQDTPWVKGLALGPEMPALSGPLSSASFFLHW